MSESPERPDAFVEVYCPKDPAQVAVIKGLLDRESIPYYFDNENFTSLLPLSAVGIFTVRLYVAAERAEECRRLLKEAIEHQEAGEPIPEAAEPDFSMPPEEDQPVPQPPIPIQPTQGRLEIWLEVFACFAFTLLPSYFQDLAEVLWFKNEAPAPLLRPDTYYLFSYLAYNFLPPIAVLLFFIWRSGEGWRRFGLGPPRWLIDPLQGLWIFIAGALLAGVLAGRIASIFNLGDPHLEPWHSEPKSALEHGFAVAVLMLAVLKEELIFRSYFLTRFEQLFGRWNSLLVTALLFSSWHIYQGPAGLLSTFVLGLVYGGAYLFLRRLWPVFLAHTINNLVLLL